MDIDKKIQELKQKGPGSLPLPQMAKLLAAMLDKASIGWVSKVFYDKKFQRLADFERIGQKEKDRVFNELIIAPLTLFMITLEAPDINQPPNFRDYLLIVRDEIPQAHVESLKSLGIEKKHLKLWKKLIKMRHEEYSQSKFEAREAMMEYESQDKEMTLTDLDGINLFLPVFTVAVGCHRHICRGKTAGKDPLFKYLIKNLSRFYSEFRAITEGAEITPWKRFKIKARHFWNDLRGR